MQLERELESYNLLSHTLHGRFFKGSYMQSVDTLKATHTQKSLIVMQQWASRLDSRSKQKETKSWETKDCCSSSTPTLCYSYTCPWSTKKEKANITSSILLSPCDPCLPPRNLYCTLWAKRSSPLPSTILSPSPSMKPKTKILSPKTNPEAQQKDPASDRATKVYPWLNKMKQKPKGKEKEKQISLEVHWPG